MSMTDAEYKAWLAGDNPRVTLAVLTGWDPDAGAESTLRIADKRYEAGGVVYQARLIEPLAIRRAVGGVLGRRGEAGVGTITIDNSKRDLDHVFDWSFSGREQEILFGGPDFDLEDFRPLITPLGDEGLEFEIAPSGRSIITIRCKDEFDRLDRPIIERPLNMHKSSWLDPYPLCLGRPQNVTPAMTTDDRPPDMDLSIYAVNAWDVGVPVGGASLPTLEVYENGKATSKSLDDNNRIGGGSGKLRFDSTDPEGRVTCDPHGAADDPVSGTELHKAGEMIEYVLRHELTIESGIAQGGSDTTVILEENASDIDDHYNAASSSPAGDETGYIVVWKRDGSAADFGAVLDYDSSTMTVTLHSALSFSVESGDRYDIVLPAAKRYGPFPASKIDQAACSALDADAPYNLGIWDGSGRMSYLDLLDQILPAMWYYITREGQLTVGLLAAPTGSPSLTLRSSHTTGTVRLFRELTPNYRSRVEYDRNWTEMSNPDESVSPNRAAFLARRGLWEMEQDLAILEKHPTSVPVDYESYILEQDDARSAAQRLHALHGTERASGTFETLAAPMSIELHDEFRVYDDGHELLADGYDFRVLEMTEHPLSGRVELEGWG